MPALTERQIVRPRESEEAGSFCEIPRGVSGRKEWTTIIGLRPRHWRQPPADILFRVHIPVRLLPDETKRRAGHDKFHRGVRGGLPHEFKGVPLKDDAALCLKKRSQPHAIKHFLCLAGNKVGISWMLSRPYVPPGCGNTGAQKISAQEGVFFVSADRSGVGDRQVP